MFKNCNPNPCGKKVGDCVVRAISIALDQPWKQTYQDLTYQGLLMCDMPSSNSVWATYLNQKGFTQQPAEYTTVRGFCKDHPEGVYILGTGTHAVAVIDGDYYDAWDSGNEVITYFFERRFFYD